MKPKYNLKVIRRMACAHYLNDYPGACAKLHGHTWVIEVSFTFDKLNEIGLAHDFKRLKTAIDSYLPDHELLNDYVTQPTAENLSKFLYDKIKEGGFPVTKVMVWESENAGCEYSEES